MITSDSIIAVPSCSKVAYEYPSGPAAELGDDNNKRRTSSQVQLNMSPSSDPSENSIGTLAS